MSSKYGVTLTGFVPKRMDEIYLSLQGKVSDALGVNVMENPQSFLNVLLTLISDEIAQSWECDQQTYHALYPSSAQGVSLDNAVQFAGLRRIADQKTFYNILCTGDDGSVIPAGTTISSITQPPMLFLCSADREISRQSCNRAKIKIISLEENDVYTIGLNGDLYTVSSGEEPDEQVILQALADKIPKKEYTSTVQEGILLIEDKNVQKSNTLLLSENMTTESVSTLINFESQDFGKYQLPNDSITKIVTNRTGFLSCTNLIEPVLGRMQETDVELRQSYIKRISAHAARMTNSIESAILDSVQGVTAVKCYENKTNLTDEYGRPPHSIEVVVSGGSDMEIAQAILEQKAGGIQTYGSTKVEVPSDDSQPVEVCFNRPQLVYAWLKITLTQNKKEALPPNYADLVKTSIVNQCEEILPGRTLFIQELLGDVYRDVTGIGYIDVKTFSTTDNGKTPEPEEYGENKNIAADVRQKILVEEKRIEVELA